MREDSDVCKWEQELNDAAFIHMRDYYRALRYTHFAAAAAATIIVIFSSTDTFI